MRFRCPFCQGIVAVDNSDLGVDVQCGHCGEIVTVPAARVATGAVISDFIILEELGRGGMGIVYLAHQISLDRRAALKVLSDHYANNAEFVVGFIKEARSAAKLNHPHIVQAYAVGEDDGIFFFAMENIDGETMKAILKRKKVIPVDEAVVIIQQIAEALDYAWKEQRLIHRDIKPDNIMMTKNGRAKLADLGLARVASDIDESEDDEEVMGTPQYISPEHLTGAPMDVRSDIYSLGATFFHLITSKFPFEGRSATEIARKHLEEQLRSPKELKPDIPDAVCDIIMKMMAKNVKERYQDAEELVEDIRTFRRGKTPAASEARSPSKSLKDSPSGKIALARKGAGGKTGKHKTATGKTGKTFKTTPRMPKTTQAADDIDDVAGSGSFSRIASEDKGAKKKMVILIAACLVALVVAGIVIFLMVGGEDAPPPAPSENTSTAGTETAAAGGGEKKPDDKSIKLPPGMDAEDQALYKEVTEVLEFYGKNPDMKDDFQEQCDVFFAGYSGSDDPNVINQVQRLQTIYIPMDEKRVDERRSQLHKEHSERVAEKRRKGEELKRKIADAKAAKERDEKRKALKEKLAKQLAERAQKRRDDYMRQLQEKKDLMRFRFIDYFKRHDFIGAKAIFKTAENEPTLCQPEFEKEAEQLADWGEKMTRCLEKACDVWKLANDSGKELAGTQLAVTDPAGKQTFGKVRSITNGEIVFMPFSADPNVKPFKISVESLSPKQYNFLMKKAAQKLGDEEARFFYLLSNGDFKYARKVAPVNWRNEYKHTVTAYLSKKLEFATDSQKEEIEKKYGSLREYRKLKEAGPTGGSDYEGEGAGTEEGGSQAVGSSAPQNDSGDDFFF